MQSKAFTINRPESQTSSLVLPYAISLVLHAVIVVVMIFNPHFSPRKKDMPNVISVSMVSMAKQPSAEKESSGPAKEKSAPPKKETEAAKVLPPPPEPEPKKETAKVETDAPKVIRIKRSLKKKTFKSKDVVKSAIKDIEKKVEKSRPDPTASAFESLRKKVKEQEETRAQDQAALEQGGGEGDESAEGGGLSGQRRAELIDWYMLEVAHEVSRNFVSLGGLAGVEADARASISFNIMPNGEIRDITIHDRSGNAHLDEQAYKALVKSSPVSPHPKGLVTPYVTMGLTFTEKGVH